MKKMLRTYMERKMKKKVGAVEPHLPIHQTKKEKKNEKILIHNTTNISSFFYE